MRRFLLLFGLLLLAQRAAAHGSEHHEGGAGWTTDPWTLVPMIVSTTLYAAGLLRLWRQAGTGRGVSEWRAACFAAGIALLVLLLLSPLDASADLQLSAHMVQHLGLMLVAAPLLVLSRPGLVYLWALPRRWRPAGAGLHRRSTLALSRPFVAWLIYLLTLWVWHLPALYQLALASDGVHFVQHATFLAAALIFWTAIIEAKRGEGRAGAFATIFATMLHSGALAALMTTSEVVWYPVYPGGLDDQQSAGLIMWVPSAAILVGAAIAVLAALLRDLEARAERGAP